MVLVARIGKLDVDNAYKVNPNDEGAHNGISQILYVLLANISKIYGQYLPEISVSITPMLVHSAFIFCRAKLLIVIARY